MSGVVIQIMGVLACGSADYFVGVGHKISNEVYLIDNVGVTLGLKRIWRWIEPSRFVVVAESARPVSPGSRPFGHRTFIWGAVCAVILALGPPVIAQSASTPTDQPLLNEPIVIPPFLGGGEVGGEVVFSADTVEVDTVTQEITMFGAVEVYTDTMTLLADELHLSPVKQSGYARGNVTAKINGHLLAVDEFRLDQKSASMLASNAVIAINDFADASARKVSSDIEGRTLIDFLNYSPCQTCIANGRDPLWSLEAKQVVLDQEQQQIYMYGATLSFFGVPLVPIPYYQSVLPGATRQTGWLVPFLSDQVGADYQAGATYFHALGDDADLSITPLVHVTQWEPTGVEILAEYRQALANGQFAIDLSAGRDWSSSPLAAGANGVDGEMRTFGNMGLNENWRLNWDWTETTNQHFDEVFLGQSAAWTNNRVGLEGFQRRNYVNVEVLDTRPAYESTDPLGLKPDYFPIVTGEYISEPNAVGLTFRSLFDARRLTRDGEAREYSRLVTDNAVMMPLHLGAGLMMDSLLGARADAYSIANYDLESEIFIAQSNNRFSGERRRVVPYWQTKLAWPIALVDDNTSAVVNPIAAFTWVSNMQDDSGIPNEDNHASELNAANLFSMNRSGGWDWIERGRRLDIGAEFRAVSMFEGSVFDPDQGSALTIDAFAGMGWKAGAVDRYDANSGLDGDMTEFLADVDVSLTNFGRAAVESRWDVESGEMTRGFATGTLNLPAKYSVTTSAERQVWQEQGSWNTEFDITTNGLIPYTERQFWQVGMSSDLTSSGTEARWGKLGLSGELGAGAGLLPWRYDVDYEQRIDGTFGQKLSADFSYNCDCAEFYIDTTFTSTSAGEWDADITFRFDLTTLIEDGELANIEEWFGF